MRELAEATSRTMRVLAFLLVLPSLSFADDSDLVLKALELFKQGPDQAKEIEKLLDEELKQRPDNHQAYFLRGKVMFYTGRLEEALKEFQTAMGHLGESVVPAYYMYEARTLFHLGQCSKAKKILESKWAFWQGSSKLLGQYKSYYPLVLEKCGAGEADKTR